MGTSIAQEPMVDYQHFIDYQLQRAQGRIKTVDVWTGLLHLFAAWLVYLLVVIALDHALVLPSWTRLVLLLCALMGAAIYTAVAVVLPGIRRISHFYAARAIEQASPEFHNSVLNFLDLRRRPNELRPGVLEALEERALADLSPVHVEEKVSHERLVRACYGVGGAVVAVCAAILFNALVMHRSLPDSLGRAFFPTASIHPPTRTRLSNVEPGDIEVVSGSNVDISVRVEGRIPERAKGPSKRDSDWVTLRWSDDGGKFWREQELTQPESRFEPWRTKLPFVEKSFDYYLVGGDCRTRRFHIEVIPAPMVTGLELLYEYPEYTGWPPYASNNGNIDALEGTQITIKATTNRPAKRGQLRFGHAKRGGPKMQLVQGADHQLVTSFEVTQDDRYAIWFTTAQDQTNPRPSSYQIKVRRDLAPIVTITQPGRDLVKPPAAANAVVPLVVQTRDDFGIEQVQLVVARDQEQLLRIDLADGKEPGKQFLATHRLDLAEFPLAAGDEITYWVDVADIRQPTRNHTVTTPYRIRVGSPMSPADRKRELARAEDAEKAVQQLGDQFEQTPEEAPPEPLESPPEQSPEPTPSDHQALEKIRRYFQDKDRAEQGERQMEQSRHADRQSEGEQQQPGQEGQGPDGGSPKQQPSEGETTEPAAKAKQGEGASKDGQGESGQHDQKDSAGKAQDQAGREKDSATAGSQAKGRSQASPATSEESGGGASQGSDQGSKAAQDKRGSGDGGQPDSGAKDTSTKDDIASANQRGSDGQGSADSKAESQSGQAETSGSATPTSDESMPGASRAKSDQLRRGARKKTSDSTDAAKASEGKGQGTQRSDQKRQSRSTESPSQETGPGQRPATEPPSAPTLPGTDPLRQPTAPRLPTTRLPSGGRSKGEGARPTGKGERQLPGPAPDAPGAEPQSTQSGKEDFQTGRPSEGSSKAGAPGPPGSAERPPSNQTRGGKPGGENAGGQQGAKPQDPGQEKGAPSDALRPDSGQQGRGGQAGGGQPGQQGSSQTGGSQQPGRGQASTGTGDQEGSGTAKTSSPGSGPAKGSGASGSGTPDPSGATGTAQAGGGPSRSKGPVPDVASPTAGDTPESKSVRPDRRPPAVDLVLERLSDQLASDEVDPELLRRLGWRRDQLEQFVKRFQGPGATEGERSLIPSARERGPDGVPRTTLQDKLIRSTRRRPGQTATDPVEGNIDAGRIEAPPEYREIVDAYRRSQARRKQP